MGDNINTYKLNGFTMSTLPLSAQQIAGPLGVLIVSWLLFLLAPINYDWFAYERDLITQQWWRLISGNFLHTNFNHLLLNSAGVILLWALHGQYFTAKSYLLYVCLLCLATTLGIYSFAPQLLWYVGLSGALHGLFMLGAYFDIKQGFKSGWLLMIAVLAKVIHEQFYGASDDIATLIDAKVAIDAHLYGCIAGVFLITLLSSMTALRRFFQQSNQK